MDWTANRAVRTTLVGGVLVVGIIASVFAGWQVQRAIHEAAHAHFAGDCDEITARIRDRLTACSLMLQGGRALMAASEKVTREEWRSYYDALGAQQTLPGYLAVGYAPLVTAAGLSRHVAETRESGLPGYEVRPGTLHAVQAPVLFIEPFAGRNLRVSGFDLFSEPVRRAAMERARDAGHASLTGRIQLVQDHDCASEPAALMFLPVYRHRASTDSTEERREALAGWIFCAFRLRELMMGVIPEWLSTDNDALGIDVYDGGHVSADTLLFSSEKPQAAPLPAPSFREERSIVFNGNRWLILFSRNLRGTAATSLPAWGAAAGGLLVTGLVCALILTSLQRLTAQRRAEGFAAQVSELAFHDILTGLPNRLLLLDRLQMSLAAGQRSGGRGALMMVDLDDFKPLNDTHGHAAGDLLLVEVARRLQACVRRTDTVARLGGDEFIVLVAELAGGDDAAGREAAAIGSKIIAALARPYQLAGLESAAPLVEHVCSASVGITLFDGQETDPNAILKRADAAMYLAKAAGRNRTHLHAPPDLDQQPPPAE